MGEYANVPGSAQQASGGQTPAAASGAAGSSAHPGTGTGTEPAPVSRGGGGGQQADQTRERELPFPTGSMTDETGLRTDQYGQWQRQDYRDSETGEVRDGGWYPSSRSDFAESQTRNPDGSTTSVSRFSDGTIQTRTDSADGELQSIDEVNPSGELVRRISRQPDGRLTEEHFGQDDG